MAIHHIAQCSCPAGDIQMIASQFMNRVHAIFRSLRDLFAALRRSKIEDHAATPQLLVARGSERRPRCGLFDFFPHRKCVQKQLIGVVDG